MENLRATNGQVTSAY